MDGVANPFVPAPYDVVWPIVFVAILALTISAVVSITRRVKQLSLLASLLWLAVIVLVPVVGPALWFAFGRPAVERLA